MFRAPGRAARPHDIHHGPGILPAGACPFCPANERETPPEVWADRPDQSAPNTPGWRVRAIPNRFPVMPPEIGVHEVVINTDRHVVHLWDLTLDELSRAIDAWALREAVIAEDPRGLWPFVFLNQGSAAGASLQHSHAQIIGFPFAPPRLVAYETAFDVAPSCPICTELRQAEPNVIARTESLIVWAPPTPLLSGAVRIAPIAHAARWPKDPGPELAEILKPALAALSSVLDTSALNLWVRQSRDRSAARFHWHVDIVPRRGTLAGMELGAGVFTVINDPEELARALRAQLSRP